MTGGWWHRHYGASPLHLAGLVACFAIAGYAADLVLGVPLGVRILVWFGGAVVLHDLVLWPLYTFADWGLTRLAARGKGHQTGAGTATPGPEPVSWVNHVRVPAVISAVLFFVSFPLILELSEPTYHAATGRSESGYLDHWLAITAVSFAASGCIYAVRRLRARPAATPPTCPGPPAESR